MRIDLLTVFTTKNKQKSNSCLVGDAQETFGGNEYVYSLDCGSGIMLSGICLNSSKCTH